MNLEIHKIKYGQCRCRGCGEYFTKKHININKISGRYQEDIWYLCNICLDQLNTLINLNNKIIEDTSTI